MLLLVGMCVLWGLTALKQEGTASAAFLPLSMERLFQEFSNIFEQSREMLGKDQFDTSVDISKLPSNYHHEAKQERKVGNSTLFSHHEIRKVTDNRTGDMMFSENSVSSIEAIDTHPDLQKNLNGQEMPEANLVKEEPISDRRHRLLAIRNGLLTAPRPIKKTLLVTPNHKVTPRKRHFFFFWRKV